MESKPALPKSGTLPARSRRRSALRIGGIALGILLLAVIVAIVVTSLSGNDVVWLTPAQLAARTQPGPFTAFKQKVRSVIAPVWTRLRRAQPMITLDCKVLTLSSATLEEAGLGEAATTNADGMQAWILAAPAATTLQQFVKTNAGANVLDSSAIQTLHGGKARILLGNRLKVGATLVGTTIDVLPRNSAGSVRLVLNATVTSKAESPSNAASIRTNLAVTCQALIPNGGSLVLDGGSPKDGGENRYWLIVSPRVWIPAGK